MKALRYLAPGQLAVEQMPDPKLEENEVLIKVCACGICGSDVHGYLGITGRRIPPMTMGHEFSGIVLENGKNANKFKIGEKVVVQPIGFCGECDNCKKGLTNMCLNKKFFGVLTKDGAFCEYVAVPEKLIYSLPENFPVERAALVEPYAVAYGSLVKSGSIKDLTVMVIGAGTIGLCILQLAKLHNPKKIIVSDLSDRRLALAKELGADEVINPGKQDYLEEISRITNGGMLDVTFEAVGVEATANQSIKSLRIGGMAVWAGMSQKEMTINMQDIVCSAREVRGTFNYTHEEFGQVVKIVGSGKVDTEKIVSKTVSLEEAPLAFSELHKRPDEFIKIIVDPRR